MLRWIFYIIGICALLAAGAVMGVVRSDIQIILAAVFGLYALVAFGFGTLLKRRSDMRE